MISFPNKLMSALVILCKFTQFRYLSIHVSKSTVIIQECDEVLKISLTNVFSGIHTSMCIRFKMSLSLSTSPE